MPTGLLTDLYGRNLRYTFDENDTVQKVYTTIQGLIKLQNFDLVYKGYFIPRDLTSIKEYPGLDSYPICVVPNFRARSLGFWRLPDLPNREPGGSKVTIRWSDGAIGQYQFSTRLERFSGALLYPQLEKLGIFLTSGDIVVDGRKILKISSIDQTEMYDLNFEDYLLEVPEFTYSQALSGVAMTARKGRKKVIEVREGSSFEDSTVTSSESLEDSEDSSGERNLYESDSDDEIVVPGVSEIVPVSVGVPDSESETDESSEDELPSFSENVLPKINIKVQGLNSLITVYPTEIPVGGNITPVDVYKAVRKKSKLGDRQISFGGRRLSDSDTQVLKYNRLTDIFRIEPAMVVSNRYARAASSVA